MEFARDLRRDNWQQMEYQFRGVICKIVIAIHEVKAKIRTGKCELSVATAGSGQTPKIATTPEQARYLGVCQNLRFQPAA
jgi:hypothetical protein